ncbi:MAG TPA: TSUP family transporter, partial [Humisphaera sp.]|nr:TSUP family transporter [Humisphaera sp.]
HFRATLQGYFLPASAITMAAYLVAGLWNWPVTLYFFWSLPPAIIAIFIGRALNHRLPEDSFLKYVYLGLAGIGVLLLGQAIHW